MQRLKSGSARTAEASSSGRLSPRDLALAARMEQNSEAGRINISHTTYDLVKDAFDCEYRGAIEAKNNGLIDMYFVTAARISET